MDPQADCVRPSPSFITGTTEEVLEGSNPEQKVLQPLSEQQRSAVFRAIRNYKLCGKASVVLKNNGNQLIVDKDRYVPQSMRSNDAWHDIAKQLYDEFVSANVKVPQSVRIQK